MIAAALLLLLSASCVPGPAMKSVDELVEQSTQPFLALALIRCSVSTSPSLSSGRVEIDLMEVKNGDNNQLAVLFNYLTSILQNCLVLVKRGIF